MWWVCPKCSIRVRMKPHEFPIKCQCKFSETLEQALVRNPNVEKVDETKTHWLTCPHRGQAIATINAREAGCGCGSSTVEVYECKRFFEPVLKKSAARCREAVAAEINGYTGRTCRECTEYA